MLKMLEIYMYIFSYTSTSTDCHFVLLLLDGK